MTTTEHSLLPTLDRAEMQRILLRAQEGDLSSLQPLRELLDGRPDLWKQVGDLGEHAEMAITRLISGANLHVFEAIRRKLAEVKAELTGPSPTPLEKLLIDRIGVCWLQVHQLDLQTTSGSGATPTPQGVWAQKRLDSAHRRYLLAVKQLATVRKLLRPELPAIQVGAFLAGDASPRKGRRAKKATQDSEGQAG